MSFKSLLLTSALLLLGFSSAFGQADDFTAVYAEVDFDKKIRTWDGFGVNYVETSQTFDFEEWPQDYGGFGVLDESSRQEIVDLVFGDDGLKIGILKMFLDPLHQAGPGAPFDHETTTGWMRYFAHEGLERMRARGDSLSIVTTMYGPPAYITEQGILRGRDLDEEHVDDLATYLIDWVRFLREKEGLPVDYLSLHNEGESWRRWPQEGTLGDVLEVGHDYNFFWTPEQLASFMKHLRPMMDDARLGQVGITNGEPTNWYRFSHFGFADALYYDEAALQALGMITSHGFYVGRPAAARWFGPHSGRGTALLRQKRPLLHAWTTSTAWDIKNNEMIVDGENVRRYIMDAGFVREIHGNIYEAGVNGLIPWAFSQRASQWNKPDPNPGSAIRVYDDGTWEVKKAYHYFKQVSRAGQPGTAVVHTHALEASLALIGFASNGTKHPDAVVVANFGPEDWDVALKTKGTDSRVFEAFRTTGSEVYEYRETAAPLEDGSDNYRRLGRVETDAEGVLRFEAPSNSVITFFAQ